MTVGISPGMATVGIPVRLAVRPFGDHWLDEQAWEIQDASNCRTLTITPWAMYILSTIAGRRIVDPIRWVLLDSLQDVLLGKLRTQYPERQDLLASTFGEILGVLFSGLTLGGHLTILRLLEQDRKTPDFLLLPVNPGGSVQAHLVECKGVVEDVNNVNARASKRLDICKRIRFFRSGGKAQLTHGLRHGVSAGPSITIDPRPYLRTLAANSATSTLAVVYVPDARIPRLIDPGVTFPLEKRCAARGADCIQCMMDPVDPTCSNVITVLHRDAAGPTALSPPLHAFVSRYQKAQNALWAGDDEYVTEVLDGLIGLEHPEPGLLSLTTGLVHQALLLGLDIRAVDARRLQVEATRSGIPKVDEDARRVVSNIARLREVEHTPIERLPADRVAARIASWDTPSSGKSLLSPITLHGHQLSAQVQWEHNSAVLRSAIDQPSTEGYHILREFNAGLIRQLGDLMHGESVDGTVEWREEFAALGGATMQIGTSYQFFPHPPATPGWRGVTAWVSGCGRAEIALRRPASIA